MKRLSPMQRGYLIGLRRARAKAQREMNDMADQFENVLAEIHREMRGVRDELAKLRTLDDAILAERDPTMWLIGFWRLGRNLLLDQSIAAVDPQQTFDAEFDGVLGCQSVLTKPRVMACFRPLETHNSLI